MAFFDRFILKELRKLAVKYGIKRLVSRHFKVAMEAYTEQMCKSDDVTLAVRAALTRFVDHIL